MEYTVISPDRSNRYRPQEEEGSSLTDLLQGKRRILRTKLDVLLIEIRARFAIRDHNLARIEEDKARLEHLISETGRLANYHFREQSDVSGFFRALFDVEAEERQQDTECWRDVVMVMRDFLYAWEAHEQARAKAIFLNDV
jgi:hypothetical protein